MIFSITYILLSNISKTANKTREISKPLLDSSPTTFLSILEEIKKRNQSYTLKQVNIFLNETLNESTYYLRKIYANMAYYLLRDESVAKTTYISQILGHEINSEHTAINYQEYFIDPDVDFDFA